MPTTQCRDCQREVSTEAVTCPHCGAYYPYKEHWDGWGFEYKSQTRLVGLPLVHIAFKYRPGAVPVIAKGWLAIGQFSAGVVNISQFGFGPFALSQFALAGAAISQVSIAVLALSQITAAYYGVCQMGVVYDGWGLMVVRVKDLL